MWNGSGRDPETGGGDARMAPPQTKHHGLQG